MGREVTGCGASRVLKALGTTLIDALVRPAGVVVVAVLTEHALKVVLPEDEDMIETLASHGADQAFAVRVRLGCHRGRADHPNAGTLRDIVEDRSELGIVVAEEELRPLPEGRQLPKLLGQPVGAGRRGRRRQEHAPRSEVQETKAK